ncbi:MAG: hypothetical protein J6A30_05125 [Ruminococcus sp.]|nr:hypothetical protein [Ruminococcus sp.]
MKRKLLSIILCSLIPAGSFCGCKKDTQTASSNNDVVDVTESVVTAETTEETEIVTTETQTDNQNGFDFIKTVESTYICGQKLSYPITWGQFGDEFTIEEETATVFSDKRLISASVRYNGYVVGIFGFTGCDSVDEINADTSIIGIYVNSEDIDYFETEKITIGDISMGIDHNKLFELLGDDYREGVGYNQIKYKNDSGLYRFAFNDDDSLITVGLSDLNR